MRTFNQYLINPLPIFAILLLIFFGCSEFESPQTKYDKTFAAIKMDPKIADAIFTVSFFDGIPDDKWVEFTQGFVILTKDHFLFVDQEWSNHPRRVLTYDYTDFSDFEYIRNSSPSQFQMKKGSSTIVVEVHADKWRSKEQTNSFFDIVSKRVPPIVYKEVTQPLMPATKS